MKTIASPPAATDPVARQVHLVWRYLDRLVNGWEHARERDLDILEEMLDDLDRELRRAGPEVLDAGTMARAEAARRALGHARETSADVRMAHLEVAVQALESLGNRFPAHL